MDENLLEDKYRLIEVYFIGDQQTGKVGAFVENYQKKCMQSLASNVFTIDRVNDDDAVSTRYGIEANNQFMYNGLSALKILDKHLGKTLSKLPKTYLNYKKTKSTKHCTSAQIFAWTHDVPVEDINRMCDVLSFDYLLKKKKEAKHNSSTIKDIKGKEKIQSLLDGRDI